MKFGQWQLTVMPFGLCNALAMFERLIENAVRRLSRNIRPVYLEYIIVLGEPFDSHVKNLEEVLTRLLASNLTFNPKMGSLFQSKVNFLGYIVNKYGVSVDLVHVAAIQQRPTLAD